MTTHIDLGTVLRQTLSASLYSNLVTRPTGRAVRTQIERLLVESHSRDRLLTVIDFSHVSMIDFSCADEVIAKLLLANQDERESYFLFRGLTDAHWHSIEAVLERHGLAIVVETEGGIDLAGVLDAREERAWRTLRTRGRSPAADVARALGEPEAPVRADLERLWRRRLIMRHEESFMPVGDVA